jgi:ribosomal protein L7Ae-like RNA K-turn-binding protein
VKTVAECNADEFARLLGFAVRAGKVRFGSTAVERGVKQGTIKLIVVDSRSSSSRLEHLARLNKKSGCQVIVLRGKRPLERIVGKVNCRNVGITDAHFAASLEKKASPKSMN